MQGLQLLQPEDRAFYEEACAWLDEHLPPFVAAHRGSQRDNDAYLQMLTDWQSEMASGHWVGVDWPKEWGGRDATGLQKTLLGFALSERKAPPPIWKQATDHVGPPLLRYGTPEQKQTLLPGIIRGDWIWCQGFSEPDAGSDLAALRTRAEPCEGGYRINGQKIWTSNAYFATRIWMLARTDPTAPKHHGISAFIVDMKTPGVTVRPIREITGRHTGHQLFNQQFNEVFFDDVFVPEFNRVGPENEGWKVCKTTLVRERTSRHNLDFASNTMDALRRFLDEPLIQGVNERPEEIYAERMLQIDMMIDGLEELFQQSLQGILSGKTAGAESSILKLLGSETRKTAAELALEVLGPYGQLMAGSPEAFKKGNAAFEFLRSRACTIGGGTSEIQRNWIAEHVLGLPKS
jgi:alkylation response protein AidB-like acyl-CoA dehydrogenase